MRRFPIPLDSFLNAVVAVSLVSANVAPVASSLGDLRSPSQSATETAAPDSSPTATAPSPTDTPEPLVTPTPTGEPDPTQQPSTATPTPGESTLSTEAPSNLDASSDFESPELIVLAIDLEAPEFAPGDQVIVRWKIEGWEHLDRRLDRELLITVPPGLTPAGGEGQAFGLQGSAFRIQSPGAAGAVVWETPEDVSPPIQFKAELILDGKLHSTSGEVLSWPDGGIVALQSGVPSFTPIGWGGDGSGSWTYAWEGAGGHQYWNGAGGNWQHTRFHTVFSSENITHEAVVEICSRGNLPFKAWSGSQARKRAWFNPAFHFLAEFTLGSWLCTRVTIDTRYNNGIISAGHFWGNEGRHQPGSSNPPPPPAVYDWEVWIKSINGYEFAPPDFALLDRATLSDCGSKNGIQDPRECPVNTCCGTQGTAGDPINTRTGGFSYSLGDLSVPTAAGPLVFQRSYSSLATDMYGAPLAPGWTHSQDTRLIFEGDPLGERGYVWFKSHGANQQRFVDNGDGTYTPYPGVLAALARNAGPPITYTLTVSNQSVYTFDEDGKLLAWADPVGREFVYSYDASDRLSQVTGPSGQRYLAFSYDAQDRITAVADHTGRQVSYGYDAAGDLTSVTDARANVWTYEYDADHRLTDIVDPLGHTDVRTEYDAQGRAVRQFDGLNVQIVEVTYNPDGSASVEDARGNVTTHVYDERNTLVSETDPFGGTTTRAYDDNFRITSITNPAGGATQYSWSSDGANLLSITDPAGNTTSMVYDALNNLTSVTDPRSNTTSFAYSGVLLTSSTDALNNTTSYAHTPDGYLETVTDPLGHTTSFGYDGFGQVTSMTDPLGNAWSYSYDTLGRLEQATDPLGAITRSEYDPAGNLTRTTLNYDPARPQNDLNEYNIVTDYAYDGAGNLVTVTDTLGRATQYQYDAADRLTGVIQPLSTTTSFAYDAAGNLTSVTDPLGNASSFTYDALNRQATAQDPLLNTTSYGYDSRGNLTSVTDANGVVTKYEYDSLNRLTAVVNNSLPGVQPDHETNVRTEYSYDAVGNLTAALDARGNSTSYAYDVLNRLLSETDPLLNVTSYSYDAAGNLATVTDAASFVTAFQYDAADRLTTIDYPAPDADVSFTYDVAGRRKTMLDGVGTTTWTYDGLGRTACVNGPTNPPPPGLDPLPAQPVCYEYDSFGNRTQIYKVETLYQASYAYDALNRLTQVTDWASNLTTYSYDAAGRLTGAALPNGVSSSYDYDAAGRLLSIDHTLGTQTLSAFNYTYEPVGNRTQAVEVLEATTTTIDYAYDPLYRLTAADYSYGAFFHYTYDEVGNRLTQQTLAGTNSYTYDAADRLIQVDGVAFTWDARGNLLSDGVRSYSYDHADRLTQVVQGLDSYSFSYNGLGDRTGQTVNGVGTGYVLDLNAGLAQVLGDGTSWFLYGLGRIGEDLAGVWQYHLGDALASVRQVTGPAGLVLRTRSYAPFGSVLSTSGLAETSYGFTGEWTDATELVHLRARYYDPGVGRFLTRDPFPGLPTHPASRHPYTYVLNNPPRYVDPSGEVIPGLAIVAGIGFLAGFGANSFLQYQASGGWCDYDLLEALGWGLGGAAASVVAAMTALHVAYLAGLGIQGFGIAANLPAAFGLGTAATAAAGSGTIWLLYGIPKAAELRLSGTIAVRAGEIATRGTYAGEPARPYLTAQGRTLLLQEIMRAGRPVPDPGGAASGLRWDVYGGHRGSSGMWELVVDARTRTIIHFLYTSLSGQ